MGVLILVLLIASALCALGASIGRWVEAPGRRPALGWLALCLFVVAVTSIFLSGVTSL